LQAAILNLELEFSSDLD